MKKKMKIPTGGPWNLLALLFVLFGSLLVLLWLTDQSRQVQELNYSTFLTKVEGNQVKRVRVEGQQVSGLLKDGTQFVSVIADTPVNWDILRKHNVELAVVDPAGMLWLWLWYVLPFLLILLIVPFWLFMRQSRGGGGGGSGGNLFNIGKSRAKMFMPSTIKATFDSVAGVQEAKEDLKDVVDFLKNPQKYRRLGAKIPRGVLLVGEPGNGKTLLARAVAGEANCPFFSISGSDFIEVFVGVGAARVRDLFVQARKHAPSIIFIDEIDAVGRQRGIGQGGGHDEREQTLNQLLTEMDGFQTSDESVIVIAATNRPDVLDKALLRPGRFDRRVMVPYPDLTSREQILIVHAKEVKVAPDVDIYKLARGTPGFTGADLANLVNEAAIIASKNEQDYVEIADFEEARDKITLGKEIKSMIQTEEDLKVTAYHESGHTLLRLLQPEHSDPLHKVSIIPRGRALGVTHAMPEREKYTTSEHEMRCNIIVALGGRIAEELVFDATTTGAYSDFQAASRIARSMVCDHGMSPALGTVVYGQGARDFVYSQKTAETIDQEVKRIVHECYDKARNLLQTNRDKLDTLAHALLERETMYAGEIYHLLEIEPRAEHSFT